MIWISTKNPDNKVQQTRAMGKVPKGPIRSVPVPHFPRTQCRSQRQTRSSATPPAYQARIFVCPRPIGSISAGWTWFWESTGETAWCAWDSSLAGCRGCRVSKGVGGIEVLRSKKRRACGEARCSPPEKLTAVRAWQMFFHWS